jgi:hypothetical protein
MKFKHKIIIGVFALLMIFLIQYAHFNENKGITVNEYLELAKIISVNGNEITLSGTSGSVVAYNSNLNLQKGQFGEFHIKIIDDKRIIQNFREFKYHFMKYILSLLAVIITIFYFFKEFKLIKEGFTYA